MLGTLGAVVAFFLNVGDVNRGTPPRWTELTFILCAASAGMAAAVGAFDPEADVPFVIVWCALLLLLACRSLLLRVWAANPFWSAFTPQEGLMWLGLAGRLSVTMSTGSAGTRAIALAESLFLVGGIALVASPWFQRKIAPRQDRAKRSGDGRKATMEDP